MLLDIFSGDEGDLANLEVLAPVLVDPDGIGAAFPVLSVDPAIEGAGGADDAAEAAAGEGRRGVVDGPEMGERVDGLGGAGDKFHGVVWFVVGGIARHLTV